MIAAVTAAVAPVSVYQLHAPQLDDQNPSRMPFVLLSRSSADWFAWDTFCGPNDDPSEATYIVDCFAMTLVEARALAKQVREAFAALPIPGSPGGEYDQWEADVRAYRVSGSFSTTLYSGANP